MAGSSVKGLKGWLVVYLVGSISRMGDRVDEAFPKVSASVKSAASFVSESVRHASGRPIHICVLRLRARQHSTYAENPP